MTDPLETQSPAYMPAATTRTGAPWWLLVASIVLALAVGAGAGYAASGSSAPASATNQSATAPVPIAVVTTPPPAPIAAEAPELDDFKLTVKVTKKTCFGSAGCNVQYHIDLNYTGPTVSDSDTYLVTYEVSGIEDGPQINTFKLHGTQYEYDEIELAQTPTTKVKLTAKVTEVEKG